MRRRLVRACVRTEDCWTWRVPSRRPRLRIEGRERAATHVMWWVVYREWPVTTPSRMIVQQCGNYRCVRPRHLGLISAVERSALRSARLELVVDHECSWCGRRTRVRRSYASRKKFCSWRCYGASGARSG